MGNKNAVGGGLNKIISKGNSWHMVPSWSLLIYFELKKNRKMSFII